MRQGPTRTRLSLAALVLALATLSPFIPAPALASTVVDAGASCAGGRSAADPFGLYGDGIRFQVLRNGKPVGEHVVEFERRGRDLVVNTRFEVKVEVLFITAYRYLYEAVDTWRDGCLIELRALVDEDGERHEVTARLDGETLAVSGPAGRTSVPLGIYPTHHWNAGVLAAERVLNTITGRLAVIRIVDLGTDLVTVHGDERPARRYAYTGDLRTEVWYDDAGRWVKMRFEAKDGSRIEYVCLLCGRDLAASR